MTSPLCVFANYYFTLRLQKNIIVAFDIPLQKVYDKSTNYFGCLFSRTLALFYGTLLAALLGLHFISAL